MNCPSFFNDLLSLSDEACGIDPAVHGLTMFPLRVISCLVSIRGPIF